VNDLMNDSPWLPWYEFDTSSQFYQSGYVGVIIPTAARSPKILSQCINSIKMAGEGINLICVIVLCPVSPASFSIAQTVIPPNWHLIALEGSFNYCRSVNRGISFFEKFSYVDQILLINDDVTLLEKNSLFELSKALYSFDWACIGPYIKYNPFKKDKSWPSRLSGLRIDRRTAPVRVNRPVSGCCMLWRSTWLKEIGQLDENFGIGWGLDEADMCLRTIRFGGRYGHHDSIEIFHAMHSTFGDSNTRFDGELRKISARYFTKKYGIDVCQYGTSHHWWPLPGVQIIVPEYPNLQILENGLYHLRKGASNIKCSLLICHHSKSASEIDQLQSFCRKAVGWDNVSLIPQAVLENGKPFSNQRLSRILGRNRNQYPAVLFLSPKAMESPPQLQSVLWKVRDTSCALYSMPKDVIHFPWILEVSEACKKKGWAYNLREGLRGAPLFNIRAYY
jgi:hypothetical protein